MYCICIWFINGKLHLHQLLLPLLMRFASDSTKVSCIYIGHRSQNSCVCVYLCFCHICVLLWGKGAVFLLLVSQSSFPFPTTECSDHLYCAMLWPVFYYLIQYCSTVQSYLMLIVTNLSPWYNTMTHMTIFEKFLIIIDTLYISYRYTVYIPSPHFG